MPLAKGTSELTVGKNIATLRHEGSPEKQAIAIAERTAGKPKPKTGAKELSK